MRNTTIVLELPQWVNEFVTHYDGAYATEEQRMHLAIELARMNVDRKTGGPFGAAIFNIESNHLVAAGVNLVVPTKCSVAHAETMAIMLAQRLLKTHNLGDPTLPSLELVTSSEPCAMCLGALVWSGIQCVVSGARDEDVRMIGFDEGPKPTDWIEALASYGILVKHDICRSEAVAVLTAYKKSGEIIYNGSTVFIGRARHKKNR